MLTQILVAKKRIKLIKLEGVIVTRTAAFVIRMRVNFFNFADK